MAYEDVPERLITGEWVPVSEIIGYAAPATANEVRSILAWMELLGIMEPDFVDDTKVYALTTLGQSWRTDFIVRLDEECPDCP